MVKRCCLATTCVLLAVTVSAQLPALSPAHLNPAIAKLSAGKPIYGVLTQDLSRENARAVVRRDTDFIFIFDIGVMGFVFNTVETREQAEAAVKSMRYPPWKAFPNTHKGPEGIRGWSPGTAVWAWGIDIEEYRRRADVWPLNPDGDLMAIMIIETQTGVRNVDAIAQVPGVTALSAAAGGDLSSSYGVPANAPEVESARQSILRACLAHNVACWISPTGKADQDRRLKEGWRMIRTADGLPFN